MVVTKVTARVVAPWHKTWSGGSFTSPNGLTVMVKVCDVPPQLIPALVNVGVTVMVATTGAVVVLIVVKDAIFPLPPAERPMLVLLLLHEYVVAPPVLLVAKVTAKVGDEWHTT